jgi:hypothetical protein
MKKIIVLLAFAFFVLQVQAQQKTAKKTTGVVLRFNETTFQFGNIYYASDGTHAFKFVNAGNGPLLLSRPRSSCGCTVPTWPKAPILPGDSGTIHVAYNTHILGEFNKTVTVYSNAPKPVVLHIHGKVIPRPKPMLPVKPADKGGAPVIK